VCPASEAGGQPMSEHSEASAATAGPRFAGSRILLAEHNLINQKVARAILSNFRCEIEVVSNGLEALQPAAKRVLSMCS
jgi:hypothetical protein